MEEKRYTAVFLAMLLSGLRGEYYYLGQWFTRLDEMIHGHIYTVV